VEFFFIERALRYSDAQSCIFSPVNVAYHSLRGKGPVSLSVLHHTAFNA